MRYRAFNEPPSWQNLFLFCHMRTTKAESRRRIRAVLISAFDVHSRYSTVSVAIIYSCYLLLLSKSVWVLHCRTPPKADCLLFPRPVWSEFSLSACRDLGSLATHWAHNEGSDQTGRMPRLIWVFALRTGHFVGIVMRRLKTLKSVSLWNRVLVKYC